MNTLTIGGAPIDTHAGQSAVQEWTRLLARRNELAVYRTLVRVGGGVQRGKHQLTGFKSVGTGRSLERLTGLLANNTILPGAFYLWIIEHLFVHNELARGVLVVDGRQVNLSAVDCPIFLLAGTKDHITPPEQVWALADLVRLQPSTYRASWSMPDTSACSWAAPTGRALDADCRTRADVLSVKRSSKIPENRCTRTLFGANCRTFR